jgi:SAM-dependent methyltransferase
LGVTEDSWAGLADAFADGAYATVKGRVRTYVLHRQLLEHLPAAPSSIVDVGGGAGNQSFPLAEAGHRVTLVDSSAAMLAKAAQRLSGLPAAVRARVTLIEADGAGASAALEAAGLSVEFDAVLCHGVIGYAPDPEPLITELCRLVRPGGVVSIMTGNPEASVVRPALERRWSDAMAAFDTRSEVGVLGVPTWGFTAAEIGARLARHGVVASRRYGVWLFTDWLDFAGVQLDPSDTAELKRIAEVELEASRREPYASISRVYHLLATRSQ